MNAAIHTLCPYATQWYIMQLLFLICKDTAFNQYTNYQVFIERESLEKHLNSRLLQHTPVLNNGLSTSEKAEAMCKCNFPMLILSVSTVEHNASIFFNSFLFCTLHAHAQGTITLVLHCRCAKCTVTSQASALFYDHHMSLRFIGQNASSSHKNVSTIHNSQVPPLSDSKCMQMHKLLKNCCQLSAM